MNRSVRFALVLAVTGLCIGIGWKLMSLDKVAEGTVKSVGSDQVVLVNEAETGAGIWEITFEVNADTEFKKIGAIHHLAEGDQIEIKYKEKDEKYVATEITKVDLNRAADQRVSLDI